MNLLAQIGRFGFVGVLATASHVAVGMALHMLAGTAPFWANLVAFCCALAVSFLGQTRLTFPGTGNDPGAFARFTAVTVTGLCLNQGLVWMVTSVLGGPYWLALAIIVATVPGATFLMLKFWALRY